MSGRGLTVDELADAESGATYVVPMVEILFSAGPLRLCLGGVRVEYGGITWWEAKLQSMGSHTEDMESTQGMQFQLDGLDPAIVVLAATEPYRGKLLSLYEARLSLVSGVLQLIDAPRREWVGRLTALVLDESDGKVSVSASAETFDSDLRRPRITRYAKADQRRRFPGDAGLDMAEQMTEAVIIWPSKEAQG